AGAPRAERDALPRRGRDGLLEREFGPQARLIARDGGDSELLAVAQIADRAVAGVQAAVDRDVGPARRVAHVRDREVVLLGPEERYGVEALGPAEQVARGRLALAFGHHPVLDADALARQRIGPACDVAGGVDARRAG